MLRWWRAAVVVLCLLALTLAITHVESVSSSTRTSQIVRSAQYSTVQYSTVQYRTDVLV